MADDTVYTQWQIPPAASLEDRKIGWVNEACEQGVTWLKQQRGHYDWKHALDVISGRLVGVDIPQYRSQLNTNHLKRNVREIVGTLSKLRPLWGYSSDNPAFAKQAHQMNLLTKSVYLEQFMDLSIKEALQYAAATCSGFLRPIYSRELASGEGHIELLSYGAPCILPVQLPASGNFQRAYAVTILDEMPIYMAHAMFPLYQERLRPTSSQYWYSNEIRKSAQGNIWKRVFGKGTSAGPANLPDLMIPIRYTYIIDLTANNTDQEIPMGEPGTSWAYTVPFVGQEIPVGKDIFRKASIQDARLYPYRRLLISSEACVMYDGPSFDMHGRLPLIQFCTDRWPWEPIGFSMVRDGFEIQQSINEQERGMADKKRAQLDMPLAYDINSVSSREAKQFDPMQPRARVGYDGTQTDKPFQTPIPPEVLALDETDFSWIEHLTNSMDKQHAISDVLALAKARMAGDDLEKVLESIGPIIEEMSRSMEPPMRELGDQMKYLILQYLPASRVLQYVGEDNITLETFDYNPQSLIPSHMPGEDPGTSDSPTTSKYDQGKRARAFASNLRFTITPRSLHEMTQMAMKLGLIQLKKAAVRIDSQTIADSWGVPNYGTIPGSTVLEKSHHEDEENIIQAARLKLIGEDSISAVAALSPPVGAVAGKQQEGRPPSGHAAPALKQKSDGRSTITESDGGGRVV